MTVLEPTPVRAVRRSAPARRSSGGLFLLPPWTRAPWLSFRSPAVILAVLGAAAILACASSSAALFLSSASSESLRVQIAAQCADAAYPVVQQVGVPLAARDLAQRVPAQLHKAGLSQPYRVVQTPGSLPVRAGEFSTLGTLFFRDGAPGHVNIVSQVPGQGVLLPQVAAQRLEVGAGGTVTIGATAVPVVGVYTDLFDEKSVRPYWCSYTGLFQNAASLDPPPPALVIATDPALIDTVVAGTQEFIFSTSINRSWVSPITTSHLTLSEARTIVAERQQAFDGSKLENIYERKGNTGLLPDMVARTDLITSGLRGPVIPIAVGGSILALLLVGAAGSYWADRRVREVRLLSSRGVGPVALAAKAGLELVIPAAAGTALGWLLARYLVKTLGPSPDIDAAAPWQAALTAGAGFVLGMLLLAGVAGLRARGATERPVGAKRSWAALVPWEVLLLAAALSAYLQLRREDGVVLDMNVAQVNLLLVSFPLLFLAGTAILFVRLIAALLPLLRRRAGRWSPALYLAVSRVTASRIVSAGLLAAVSMPIGVLVYSSALTGTSQVTLAAKARVLTGSAVAVISVDRPTRTPAIDKVGTIVARYPYGQLDGNEVNVLAVEPATFARWAFWNDTFADKSLPSLLSDLGPGPDGSVKAIAMGLPRGTAAVKLGERTVQLDVVDTARTFPGRRLPEPLIVVDKSSLGSIDRSAGRFTEIWSTRSSDDVRAALDPDTRVLRILDVGTVFSVANFLGVTWTFGYLQALAAFVGAVALGGLLLYLETRQRTRVASYAMARRMGLSPGSHLRSLFAELGALLGLAFLIGAGLGWVAVLTVYRGLEIDPTRPPGPLLSVPTLTIAAAALATALIAALAAGYAQHAASRADMAEVLRLGS